MSFPEAHGTEQENGGKTADQLIPATPELLATEPLPFRVRLRNGSDATVARRYPHAMGTKTYLSGEWWCWDLRGMARLDDKDDDDDITHIIRAGDGEADQPDELASLRAENDELREEIKRLHTIIDLPDDVTTAERVLKSANIEMDESGIRAHFAIQARGFAVHMAERFCALLDQLGVKNYAELQMQSQWATEHGRCITVTVQSQTGKTPGDLRAEAEAEAERLRAEVERLRKALRDIASLGAQHACREIVDTALRALGGDA